MKERDISLLPLTDDQLLVVACDSCGGVGNKRYDAVKVDPETVGYYTCRVALMEVMAVGAAVRLVVDTLAVEWEPSGQRIYAGIQRAMSEAKLSMDAINGSTEENFPMSQTAMGITVVGTVHPDGYRSAFSKPGDQLVVAGIPKVGKEIRHPTDRDVIAMDDFMKLRNHPAVKDMIPVGSSGIRSETMLISRLNQLSVNWLGTHGLDLDKSAGPATCLVAAVDPRGISELKNRLKAPLTVVALLEK